MKKYIVIFREPDGRTQAHSDTEIKSHRENWNKWWAEWHDKLEGGGGLTTNGRIIREGAETVSNDIHRVGLEIVGGFALLNAEDLDEATMIAKTCPIFEFGGYAEIREIQR